MLPGPCGSPEVRLQQCWQMSTGHVNKYLTYHRPLTMGQNFSIFLHWIQWIILARNALFQAELTTPSMVGR